MAERKAWTKEEDQALINVIQNKNIKKWALISKAMETEFHVFGRTGKQCRERWHNQLDPTINVSEWTVDEEKTLFLFHNKFGNKWAKISKELNGRTDNCVKNHFYWVLRRAFKRLNRFALETRAKFNLKELKHALLTKLITTFSDKSNKKLQLSTPIIDKSIEIKGRLLLASFEGQDTPENQVQMHSLIKQIFDFSKSYKRKKSKKVKEPSEDDIDNDDDFELSIRDESESKEVKHVEEIQEFRVDKVFTVIDVRPQKQHVNLFGFAPCQIINSSREEISEAKESIGAFELIRKPSSKPSSKIMQDEGQEELIMVKKGSNFSSWSMTLKQLPLREKISELSINRANSDIVDLNEPPDFDFKYMFGCDLEQLNN